MVQVQQRVLIGAALLAALAAGNGAGPRFYPDDPLWKEPPPRHTPDPKTRKLNEYYDFFLNTLAEPGQPAHRPGGPVRAQAVNTLDEVPDSPWYTNRHGRKRMTLEELAAGPGNQRPPDASQPWTVTGAKTEGITPGLTIADGRGRGYLIKFDPASNPELASAADVIGSKFFYALGYNVPENYIVTFTRAQLRPGEKATLVDSTGRERPLRPSDIDLALRKVPKDREGRYRALASLFLEGKPIGPFRYHGTRGDDPNDVVPHEHRRDLRGLFVFSAWLNHTDTKALNSLDTLVEANGVRFIRHHLIDFGATLGSDSFEAKSPRAGHVYLYDFKPAAAQFLSLGLYVPRWMRAEYPHLPSVGNFEAETFDPLAWKNNYPNAAFENRLPDDDFWAAKQVMAFTGEEIRAIVATGEYSDPAAAEYVARVLIARRDKIGKAMFSRVLPLDRFRMESGELKWDDLGGPGGYRVRWSKYNNGSGDYRMAEIRAAGGPAVRVWVRDNRQVVGVERDW